METRGTHLLSEYEGCDPDLLDDASRLEIAMRVAARAAGATVVAAVFHPFTPCGVSGVLLLEESHVSIHTWPEKRFCSADFYTCGDCDPVRAHAALAAALGAESSERMEIERGVRDRARSMRVSRHELETTKRAKTG